MFDRQRTLRLLCLYFTMLIHYALLSLLLACSTSARSVITHSKRAIQGYAFADASKNPDYLFACSSEQYNILQSAISDFQLLASDAATALAEPDAGTSTEFVTWLGADNANSRISIRANNFVAASASIIALKASEGIGFETEAPPNGLTYMCDTDSVLCKATSGAAALSHAEYGSWIILCPEFFLAPSLDKQIADWQATRDMNWMKPSAAFMLLHEAQHLAKVVGDKAACEDVQDHVAATEKGCYSPGW